VNAQEIANGISDGINAISGLLDALGRAHGVSVGRPMTPGEIADGLIGMDQALAAFIDTKTVEASFRPREEDLHLVRRLRQLVTVWRDTGVAALDLAPLAEECLAMASAWR